MRVSDFDEKLRIQKCGDVKMKFYDASESPFKIFGVIYDKELGFHRMDVKDSSIVNEGVDYLQKHTAGGRIAFSTDSRNIYIKIEYFYMEPMPHMAITGSSGFSLVRVEKNKNYKHMGTVKPSFTEKTAEEMFKVSKRKSMNTYMFFMPLYNNVKSVSIGFDLDAVVDAPIIYESGKAPILYYGSSITQGGCASRPDNEYQCYVSEKYDIDFINLGFSGSARAEDTMIDYLARQNPSIFVLDYDHNSPSAEHLKSTHSKLFNAFRKAHPNTPVIMISKPNYFDPRENFKENKERKQIIYQTYKTAIDNGDKNVYFIDGGKIYPSSVREHCAVDTCHPTDLGFYFIGKAIIKVIEKNKLL